MENHMEDNDIPKFRTYRGEIEFEGTLIQADIFIDNKMLEDRNSFLISFLCKSNMLLQLQTLQGILLDYYPIQSSSLLFVSAESLRHRLMVGASVILLRLR